MARTAAGPTHYPDSDGLPMAESEFQLWPIIYAGSALASHYRMRDDVYVSGCLLYDEEGNNQVRVAPDVFVVFGIAKHKRSTYLLWQEGKAPDFVMEISSPSTWRTDQGPKRELYARMGVSEYWLYDPTGDCFAPPLQGFRLAQGGYVPMPVAQRADGVLAARSEVLGLELHLDPAAAVKDGLRFYDPATAEPLRSLQESVAALQAAEARIRQLEAQLRALRHDSGEPTQEPDDQRHGR